MLKPLADHVLVKVLEAEEVTAGGIVLPDTAREKPQEGEVVAVGTGKVLDDGKRVDPEVRAGDRVVFSKYGGDEITYEGDDYKILRESDILAVLPAKKATGKPPKKAVVKSAKAPAKKATAKRAKVSVRKRGR